MQEKLASWEAPDREEKVTFRKPSLAVTGATGLSAPKTAEVPAVLLASWATARPGSCSGKRHSR